MKQYTKEELKGLQIMQLPGGFTYAFYGEIISRILCQMGIEANPQELYDLFKLIESMDSKNDDLVESVSAVIEEICEADNVGPIVMERYVIEKYMEITGQTIKVPTFVEDAARFSFAPFAFQQLDLFAQALAAKFAS